MEDDTELNELLKQSARIKDKLDQLIGLSQDTSDPRHSAEIIHTVDTLEAKTQPIEKLLHHLKWLDPKTLDDPAVREDLAARMENIESTHRTLSAKKGPSLF